MSYTKLALIFGCNYPGTTARLSGCIYDAERIRDFLTNRLAFAKENVVTLYDRRMTKNNMLSELDKLVAKAKVVADRGQIPAIFLYYSGHGTQVGANSRASEFNDADGNEALVPYDFRGNNFLIDDVLNQRFVKRIDSRAQVFIMTDCCNSGTNFDLTYQGITKAMDVTDLPTNIIQLAGCRDRQFSMEDSNGGLLTTRFLNVFRNNPVTTVPALRDTFRDLSAYGNPQQPQVSVSREDLINASLFPWLINPVRDVEIRPSVIKRASRDVQYQQTMQLLAQILANRT